MSRTRQLVLTGAGWAVGAAISLMVMLVFFQHGGVLWGLRSPSRVAAALVGLLATLGAARIGASARTGPLDTAGVLVCALVPLALGAWVAPDLEDARTMILSQPYQTDLGKRACMEDLARFARSMEGLSLAALVGGAVGLARLSWVGVALVALAAFIGWPLGAQVAPDEGRMLGVMAGAVCALALMTAHRSRRGEHGPRAARGLAVLAMAMVVAMASDLAWYSGDWFGPYPYGGLWPLVADVVYAYRVMAVRLVGCALVGAYLLWPRRTTVGSHPVSDTRVWLLAGLVFMGSAIHLRHRRIALLDWQWTHAEQLLRRRVRCSCEGIDPATVVRLGERLPTTELPWPMHASIDVGYRMSVLRAQVQVVPPASTTSSVVGSSEVFSVHDSTSYGDFIRRLNRLPRGRRAPAIAIGSPDR